VLGVSSRGFGARSAIHLWLPPGDFSSANLMILIAYVLANHPDWKRADISIFDVVTEDEREERSASLHELVRSGRLPISERNVEVIVPDNGADRRQLVNERSRDADFTLIGLRREVIRRLGVDAFEGYDEIGNVGFVIGVTDVEMEREDQDLPSDPEDQVADEGEVLSAETDEDAAAPEVDPSTGTGGQ
jgi:hypothetical protein